MNVASDQSMQYEIAITTSYCWQQKKGLVMTHRDTLYHRCSRGKRRACCGVCVGRWPQRLERFEVSSKRAREQSGRRRLARSRWWWAGCCKRVIEKSPLDIINPGLESLYMILRRLWFSYISAGCRQTGRQIDTRTLRETDTYTYSSSVAGAFYDA